MKTNPPPRLWIVHRPEHEHALVVRRGPSKRFAFFGWNRTNNEIELGQWLKGKIYPKRADISADGKYVIYFAHNGKWESESMGSWTAVSRYPYMKAVDFWPKGDAWNGGGMFLSNRKYLLYERFPHQRHTFSGRFEVKRGIPEISIRNNECLGIYIPKLIRDGWKYEGLTKIPEGKTAKNANYDYTYHLTKKISHQISIQKTIHSTIYPPKGKSFYYEEHSFKGAEYEGVDFSDIENLDYYNGKLFWPYEGKIYSAEVIKNTIKETQLIHDFSDYRFKALQAPY